MNFTRALVVLLLVASCARAQINATAANAAQQGFLELVTDAGGDDTYVGCPTVPILAYGTGTVIRLFPTTTNTGAANINVCSLGVKNIKTSAGADPADGAIVASHVNLMVYNGTEFRLVDNGGSGSGIGTAFSSTVATSFSATPTFTVPSSATTGANFKITLTGNVTSSTLASAVNGQMLNWIICQDATGGRSFVWPSTVIGGITINSVLNSEPSTCYQQTFSYDGSNAYGYREVTAGSTGALVKSATNQIDIDTTIVPRLASSNTWTASQTFATKYTIPFGSLTAAGTTDVTLVSLGATQVITKCLAKHTANFTGGALSAMTVSIGNTTTVDQFCPVLTVFSGTGNTSFVADGLLGKRTFAAENVVAHFTCTSANCNAATAGSLDIYLWIENLP
jgi:hypothetical protein